MEENVQLQLEKNKKIAKTLKIVSAVVSALIAAMLFFFLLAPAARLTTDGGKYINGYNYYGWQLTFIGCGYPPVSILCLFEPAGSAAGDFVPGSYDFGFNIFTCLAVILPILTVIVCSIVKKRMKNKGKAVCEFISAVMIVAGVSVLLNCTSLSTLVATDMGAGVGFKKQYLLPAMEAGTYNILIYPVILFVAGLIAAVVKAGNGAFLLYQKAYAKKNRTSKN